jgi:hypothetical protein
MSEERKSKRSGVDAESVEPPPAPDGRSAPSIPASNGQKVRSLAGMQAAAATSLVWTTTPTAPPAR